LPDSDPPQTPPLGDIRVSDSKYVPILIRPPVPLGVRLVHSCYQPSTTVVSAPVWSTVVNGVRRSEPVVYNHRLLFDDFEVEQEAVQLPKRSILSAVLLSTINTQDKDPCNVYLKDIDHDQDFMVHERTRSATPVSRRLIDFSAGS